MTQETPLADALAQCQEDKVMALVKEKLAAGVAAIEIVAECNKGMIELGNQFEQGQCFIPQLMFGGMIMKNVTAELEDQLAGTEPPEPAGTVVIGTVQHDVHDIGKNVTAMLLRGVGFAVIDLGVNVPPDQFVEAVKSHDPLVVGLSILLTTCFRSVAATVDAIKAAGLREKVSIMLGGAAASDLLSQNAGCDFYGVTAVDGMKYVTKAAGS